MDEFYNEATTPDPELELEPFYNRHYITIDAQGRITSAWSDGPHPDRDTAGAICINEQGGYQVYLKIEGSRTEDNPSVTAEDGIPLYKWDGMQVLQRTEDELEADRAAIPEPPPSQAEQLEAQVTYTAMMTDTLLEV